MKESSHRHRARKSVAGIRNRDGDKDPQRLGSRCGTNPEEGGGFRSDSRIIHLIVLLVVSGLFSECGEDETGPSMGPESHRTVCNH